MNVLKRLPSLNSRILLFKQTCRNNFTKLQPENASNLLPNSLSTIAPGTVQQIITSPLPISFHQRLLPANLVSFTSPEGKRLFKDCLGLHGTAESYFSLCGNYTNQSEPSLCGLSSLAMVLNAFEVDPGRVWKGVWRWYSDELLYCCASIDCSGCTCGISRQKVMEKGITFAEFVALAKCNSLGIETFQHGKKDCKSNNDIETFEKHLISSCSSESAAAHIVVNFDRKTLLQTGNGHFSPIGAYHPIEKKVLILDVARFKYPPFWVPLKTLWDSFKPIDASSGESRGYFVLYKQKENLLKPAPFHTCKQQQH